MTSVLSTSTHAIPRRQPLIEEAQTIRTLHIALLGCGTVGRGLLQLLAQQEDWLLRHKRLKIRVTGMVTRTQGCLMADESQAALSPQVLLKLLSPNTANNNRSATSSAVRQLPYSTDAVKDLIAAPLHDIVIEITPTVTRDASQTLTPAFLHIQQALLSGKDVVTANKGPIAEHYAELTQLARQNHCQLRFEATVMSGTPVFSFVRNCLAGNAISSITGILNGTSNFILNAMENELSYETALQQAQAQGYAETDPSYDVSGKDAMLKTVILANALCGAALSLADVPYEGIEQLSLDDIRTAMKSGYCYKLLSHIETLPSAAPRARVVLSKIPRHAPLAAINKAVNALTLTTQWTDAVTIAGLGAGQNTTAYGLFNDILDIAALARTSD